VAHADDDHATLIWFVVRAVAVTLVGVGGGLGSELVKVVAHTGKLCAETPAEFEDATV
jgi:hypothetical protein